MIGKEEPARGRRTRGTTLRPLSGRRERPQRPQHSCLQNASERRVTQLVCNCTAACGLMQWCVPAKRKKSTTCARVSAHIFDEKSGTV